LLAGGARTDAVRERKVKPPLDCVLARLRGEVIYLQDANEISSPMI
jgi:hypothetical protein